jgi:hypothetical protein
MTTRLRSGCPRVTSRRSVSRKRSSAVAAPICDARQEGDVRLAPGTGPGRRHRPRSPRNRWTKGVGFCQAHSVGLAKMELLQTSSQLATAVPARRGNPEAASGRTQEAARVSDAAGQGRAIAGYRDAAFARFATVPAEASAAAVARLLPGSAPTRPGLAGLARRRDLPAGLLRVFWAAAASGPRDVQGRWSGILATQLERLGALQKTLADYAHNSTSDRRHLITREQAEAGAASIRLFGGTPDRDRQR